jgi:hypothetical protein
MSGLKKCLSLREIDSPSFFVYNDLREPYLMDKEKLKLIVRNLELLVDSLKAEVYSDVSAYKTPEKTTERFIDYDELYDDDDGYAD